MLCSKFCGLRSKLHRAVFATEHFLAFRPCEIKKGCKKVLQKNTEFIKKGELCIFCRKLSTK